MAERRRGGRKPVKEEEQAAGGLSKEDEPIAKFVRFNCPTKTGFFNDDEVHYFSGKKAIDTLVDSKKYGSGAKDPKFASRAQAEAFLSNLLQNGVFFRAKILVPKKKEDPRRPKSENVNESPRVRRVKQAEESNKDEGESGTDTKKEEQPPKKEEEKEKKKKKIKLVVHPTQTYLDDTDVYVWIFDPTPFYKQLIGLLIVLGVILACLFPLWPDWLRLGVYYLSVTGISLFGLLLGVALLRTILFGIIWASTMGRHHLWILPNLTEDCGFFESFQPWYTYEYCPANTTGATKKDKKKKKESDEEPLIEDIEEPSSSKQTPKPSKKSKESKPTTPVASKKQQKQQKKKQEEEEVVEDETDPEEKYSKSGSEENSSAEEDEVSENDNQDSNNASTGESSEPADVVNLDTTTKAEETEEPQTTPVESEEKPNKSRRRRVRRADDDFVMVNKTDG